MKVANTHDTGRIIGTTFRADLAFPFMSESMIRRAAAYGDETTIEAGTALFARGDRYVDFIIVLAGALRISAPSEVGDSRIIGDATPGQFTGETDLLSSQPTLVGVTALEEARVIRIARASLARLMRNEADIANLITQAAIWRRVGILQDPTSGLVIVGEPHASETVRLRKFLLGNGYPHRLIEPGVEELEEGAAEDTSPPRQLLPAVVFPDGQVFHRPTILELASNLGIVEPLDAETAYDLTVIGGGPAGLAAAVYGASEGLSTVVIEGLAPGGQAGTSSKIENYLGFPTGVSGWELANRAQMQAQKFGARLAIAREAESLQSLGSEYCLRLSGGASIRTRALVIATGARYRKLDVPNYDRFENQGIHYAATGMEANLCRGRVVVIIGGGNSAGQAAVYLSGFASHIHHVIRRRSLRDTMSQYLISRIESCPDITLHTDSVISGLDGDDALQEVTLRNLESQQTTTLAVGDIFVMIGAEPNTSWIKGQVRTDVNGFICTGGQNGFEATSYATNLPGIYAVGDVRSTSIKRVASAVGEGSVVVSDIHRYLARLES